MSVSVQHNGDTYLSSKEAARRFGYTSDYVARLARQGKVVATRVGTQWFVDPKSLEEFTQIVEATREERKSKLRSERLAERTQGGVTEMRSFDAERPIVEDVVLQTTVRSVRAHVIAFATVSLGLLAAVIGSFPHEREAVLSEAVGEMRITAYGMYRLVTDSVGMGDPLRDGTASVIGASDDQTTQPFSGVDAMGLVIFPNETASATVDRIQNSFSDEVTVELDEASGRGTITPVFEEGVGDRYQFVVVPINSPP